MTIIRGNFSLVLLRPIPGRTGRHSVPSDICYLRPHPPRPSSISVATQPQYYLSKHSVLRLASIKPRIYLKLYTCDCVPGTHAVRRVVALNLARCQRIFVMFTTAEPGCPGHLCFFHEPFLLSSAACRRRTSIPTYGLISCRGDTRTS
jgi:hypothetical protein